MGGSWTSMSKDKEVGQWMALRLEGILLPITDMTSETEYLIEDFLLDILLDLLALICSWDI